MNHALYFKFMSFTFTVRKRAAWTFFLTSSFEFHRKCKSYGFKKKKKHDGE